MAASPFQRGSAGVFHVKHGAAAGVFHVKHPARCGARSLTPSGAVGSAPGRMGGVSRETPPPAKAAPQGVSRETPPYAYLPMQKREKISPRMSSTSTRPISRSSANSAARRSSATISTGACGSVSMRAQGLGRLGESLAVALLGDQARHGPPPLAEKAKSVKIFQQDIEILPGCGADRQARRAAGSAAARSHFVKMRQTRPRPQSGIRLGRRRRPR